MNHVRTRPAGTLGILAAALVIVLGLIGVTLPIGVATGLVVLAIAGSSVIAPRWGEGRSLLAEHPTGVTGATVTVLVWLGPLVGVSLDPDQAVTLIAAVAAVASWFTPRVSPVEFDAQGRDKLDG